MTQVVIVGDIHANFNQINALIASRKIDILLQCGDYGWFPAMHNHPLIGFYNKEQIEKMSTYEFFKYSRIKFDQFAVKNHNTKIYWCDGNHEDHSSLIDLVNKHGRNPIEIQPDIYYMPRGSILAIPNIGTILFIGGADSIDKDRRIPNVSWWAEETISYADFEALPDIKVDIMISHTIPDIILDIAISKLRYKRFYKSNDPSRVALSEVYKKYKPSLWYAGHFHRYTKFKYEDTIFTILAHSDGNEKWWEKLTYEKGENA